MPGVMTNIFWIAANIIFDVATGETKQVLMLVNSEREATHFSKKDVETYFSFVQRRAANIQWSIDPPIPQRPHGFLIRGTQVTAIPE